MSKLSIGTAQFGLDYGVANTTGKTKIGDVAKILSFAKSNDINSLDTAIQYGDSETILGNYNVSDWNVITKVAPVPEDCGDVYEYFYSEIKNSLSRLKIESFDGILVHDIDQLKNKNSIGSEIFESLKRLKNLGLTKKIGLSIYNPDDLNEISHLSHYDIVQSPFNLIDRRLLKSGWMAKLKETGTEIHVRSIFLQGLLLMQQDNRPRYFDQWSEVLNHYDNFLKDSNANNLEVCLNYPFQFEEIDKIIIGVDNFDQFVQIINSIQLTKETIPEEFVSEDLDLINPRQWKC